MSKVQEQVFLEGDSYFDSVQRDIMRAKTSIDVEIYAFNNDKLGQHVAQLLADAVARGIKVRVMIDGAGTRSWSNAIARRLVKTKVKTRIYHPFPWRVWQWSRSTLKMPWILKLVYLLLNINSRNHRKVFIIDQKIIYIASMNIDQRHLSRERGGKGWRDTGVRLVGTDAQALQDVFNHTWNGHKDWQQRIQNQFKTVDSNAQIRLNDSRHRRRVLYKSLLRKIARSKERIWITNAYFVPDNFLLKKLKEAAEDGVDVRIVLPRKSDVAMMPWASAAFYAQLLRAGIRIFEYLPSMLHAKSLIMDEWVLVGTSNLNHRSLLHDREVDVVLSSKTCKQKIIRQFKQDLEDAEEVHLDDLPKRPLHQRWLGKFILYLKYWI